MPVPAPLRAAAFGAALVVGVAACGDDDDVDTTPTAEVEDDTMDDDTMDDDTMDDDTMDDDTMDDDTMDDDTMDDDEG